MGLFACFGPGKVLQHPSEEAVRKGLVARRPSEVTKLGHEERASLQLSADASGGVAAAIPNTPEMANARALVRSLARKPESRRHLARLLVLDGRDKMESWWVEEGYSTDLDHMLLALEEAKTRDRLFVASRYQTFTLNQVRQAVKSSEDASRLAEDAAVAAEHADNAADTTAKAHQAALHSSQAANAAAAAEGNAMGSANHARIEQSMAALTAAMAAMALFDQAKTAALTASEASARACSETWTALEKLMAVYTSHRQYYLLDDLCDATAAAKRAISLSKESAAGWGAGSMQGRQTALGAAKQAVDAAEQCAREVAQVVKSQA